MLKREHNSILHPFEWRVAMRTSEAFGNDHSDPALHVFGIPTTLFEYLGVERRESQEVLVTISIDARAEVCQIFLVLIMAISHTEVYQ